jgi:acyl dehydratase
VWRTGSELRPVSVPITRELLVRYAGASGDFNPIHYDDQAARRFGLPGVIAHGMLNMGLMARAVRDQAPEGARLVSYRVRFAAMVRPGETLRIQGRVAAVDRTAEGWEARLQLEAVVEEVTVLKGDAVFCVPAGTETAP